MISIKLSLCSHILRLFSVLHVGGHGAHDVVVPDCVTDQPCHSEYAHYNLPATESSPECLVWTPNVAAPARASSVASLTSPEAA